MKENNADTIGRLKDTVDNLRGALEIPMPAEFHVRQIKKQLEDLSGSLRAIYVDEQGDDPWQV